MAKNILKRASKKNAKTLIMLPDGLAGDGLRVIKGTQKVLGEDFEIVGGSFGDEDQFKNTYPTLISGMSTIVTAFATK